jgi:hypothetical protein
MPERRAFTDEDLARLNLAPLVYPDSWGRLATGRARCGVTHTRGASARERSEQIATGRQCALANSGIGLTAIP